MPEAVDREYYEVIGDRSWAEKLLLRARKRMHQDFLRVVDLDKDTTILDVGVSNVQVQGANFLESVYPHPEKISACGLGDGAEFVTAFPDVSYTQIVPNNRLPYGDRSFEVATANAVLEHVGSIEKQKAFISELRRVARQVFLTVPHRYFPVEHHTSIPVLHYTDPTFRLACSVLGKERWLAPEHLILMTKRQLRHLSSSGGEIGYTGIALGPFSSNLFLYIDQR